MFCKPGEDKILICPPTYGMYSVCAQVNDVGVVKVPLEVEGGKFQLRVDEVRFRLMLAVCCRIRKTNLISVSILDQEDSLCRPKD